MLQHHSCVSAAAAAYWPPDVISNVLPKLLPPHTMTLDPLQHLFEWVIQYSKLHWPWHWRSTVLFKTAYCFFFAKEQHFGLSDYLSQKAPMQLLIVLGNFLSFFFFFNWCIVDLYCCVSSPIQQSESGIHTHIPAFLNFLYIQVTQNNE